MLLVQIWFFHLSELWSSCFTCLCLLCLIIVILFYSSTMLFVKIWFFYFSELWSSCFTCLCLLCISFSFLFPFFPPISFCIFYMIFALEEITMESYDTSFFELVSIELFSFRKVVLTWREIEVIIRACILRLVTL